MTPSDPVGTPSDGVINRPLGHPVSRPTLRGTGTGRGRAPHIGTENNGTPSMG